MFVNADLIAAGLAPFQPELVALKAGRLMLREIAEHEQRGSSFAFETTLSGRAYARDIARWQTLGYHVKLFFLSLPDADMAVDRVAWRVRQGGHHIPEETIRRRFTAGLWNFDNIYRPLVDAWALYDNAGKQPVLMNWGENE